MPSKHKPRLSRGVLDMKFMQRTKAKVAKEEDDEQSRALYSNEINDKMLKSNSNFIIEPSYAMCEGLIDGRLSFRGMNPELERLMDLEKESSAKPVEQKTEVTDQEMATAYFANKAPSASKNMQKKFNTKNENKKRPYHNNETPVRTPGRGAGGGGGGGGGSDGGGSNKKFKKPQFLKPAQSDDSE